MVTDYSEKYLPQNSHDATQQIHPFKKIPSKDLPSLLSRLEEEVQCMNTAVFETHAMMEHLRDTAGSNLFASMRRSLTKLSKYSRKCVKTTNTLKEQYEGLIRCNFTHDVPKSGAAAKKSKRKAVNKETAISRKKKKKKGKAITFAAADRRHAEEQLSDSEVKIDSITNAEAFHQRTVDQALGEFTLIKKNIILVDKKTILKQLTGGVTCSCPYHARSGCGADTQCENRVVQQECSKDTCALLRFGKTCKNQRLIKQEYPEQELKTAGKKGLGMFASETIQAGTLVNEYVGEVIDVEESKQRLNGMYEREQHKYLMNLVDRFIVDATRKGNFARFINHSCDPNCEVQLWYSDEMPRLAIISLRDIIQGEELSLNYNFKRFGQDTIPMCFCESQNCAKVFGTQEVSAAEKARRLRLRRRMDRLVNRATQSCGVALSRSLDPVTQKYATLVIDNQELNSMEAFVKLFVDPKAKTKASPAKVFLPPEILPRTLTKSITFYKTSKIVQEYLVNQSCLDEIILK